MKKIAILILLLPVIVFGQAKKVNNLKSMVAPVQQINESVLFDNNTQITNDAPPRYVPESYRIINRTAKYPIVELGKSQYGLQTNASIARRIIVYPNGKISAVWTTSPDESPFTRRGTGLNFYNGSSWITPPVELRIETDRAGWPNIGTYKVGGNDIEYVISHFSSSVSTDPSGGIIKNVNSGIGQTDWTQTFLDKASGPIWHRTANEGDYIHIVSTYSDTNKYVNALRTPTVYSRYQISTNTFLKKYSMLPGYDTSISKLGNGDDYAIDAKGNVVAIVMAPARSWAYVNSQLVLMNQGHVVLWKSVDSGATFKRIVIDSIAPQKPVNPGDTFNFDYPDGAVSLMIDNDGYVNVSWAFKRGFIDLTNAEKYYIGVHGLKFWDEKSDTIREIPTAKVWDRNGNHLLDVETAIRLSQTRTVNGLTYAATGYGRTNKLLTFPQITIDSIGNIFIVYSAILEKSYYFSGYDDNTDSINENFRNVYVVYSKDKGKTWGMFQNITNNPNMEDVFASVSKNCYGNKLHIIFQEDAEPGTDVQNGTPAGDNFEYYIAVPITDILNNQIGLGDSIQKPNSVNDQKRSFDIGNNYPNPFSGETYVDIKLSNTSNINITMNNVLGQQVLENNYRNVPAGNRTLGIDCTGLESGIYFLNVRVGSETKTIKTMIK